MNTKNFKKSKKQKTLSKYDRSNDDEEHRLLMKDLDFIKKNRSKTTKIDDYYEHDPEIYDEKRSNQFEMKRKNRSEEDDSDNDFNQNDDEGEGSEYSIGETTSEEEEENGLTSNQFNDEQIDQTVTDKFSVGELVITEDNNSETTGAETAVVGGLNALPKSIR